MCESDATRHALSQQRSDRKISLLWHFCRRASKPARDGTRHPRALQSELLPFKWAAHPKRAAAVVLSEIYSRQQAENPALQPAASELR
jgi:hypothetical protein